MKLKNFIIAGAVMLASAFAASRADAEAPILFTNTISLTLSAQVQSPTNTSGGVSTVAKPTSLGITTTTVLQWIARDENAEGNYTAGTTFPTGAYLVLIVESTGDSADFQVLGKEGNLLVDCSDLFSVSHGDVLVNSGSVNDSDGLFDTSVTTERIFNLSYDDTSISSGNPVNVTFETGGLETKTLTDSTPKSGAYTETIKTTVSSCIGEGTYQGQSLVLTGKMGFGAKRSVTLL